MRIACLASLCALVCAVALGGSSAVASPGQTQTFKSEGCSNFTVPAGVTSISATATGSAGSTSGTGAGGTGDEVSGAFSVTPAGQLDVCVDVGGGLSVGPPTGNGGGASGISTTASDFSAPLMVAGGGGGGGVGGGTGGNAGSPQGTMGHQGSNGSASAPGTGGSQTQPGTAGFGSFESGGNGTAGGPSGPGGGGAGGGGGGTAGGGGGGGGYNGGGGGGAAEEAGGGGGGGGSDYCNATFVSSCSVSSGAGSTFGSANNSGSAEVTLSWAAPVTFTTAGACSTLTVPAGVGAVYVEAIGAAGGAFNAGAGGKGDEVNASVAVTPGETLDACVDYGGGSGGLDNGGGASGVSAGANFSSPLLVAGGGGGEGEGDVGGGSAGSPSGHAGTPANASNTVGAGGGGGNNTLASGGAGGAASGETPGDSGTAGLGSTGAGPGAGGTGNIDAGGGGGGYYGGGGGGDGTTSAGAGGGGSDYCNAALVTGCATAIVSGAGTQTVAGTSAGDAQVLISYGLVQLISFTSTPPDSATVGSGTYDVAATGGGSGSPVTFSIDAASAGICTVSGSTVSFTGVGTCQVDANEAGGRGYDQAPQVSQSFAIAAAPGNVTATPFTAAGCQSVIVPLGVTSVRADAVGSAGQQGSSSLPGTGDGVSGTFAVTPGEQLDVCVAADGGPSSFGDGGGASGVSAGSNFSAPLIVAGGGGASGGSTNGGAGGDAGEPQGASGLAGPAGPTAGGGGAGGSQTGFGSGGHGTGGSGGSGGTSGTNGPGSGGSAGASGSHGGGGGGAGYYGGGGGGFGAGSDGGGGGGGSDYCNATLVTGCAVASGAGTGFDSVQDGGSAEVTLTYNSANSVVFSGMGCQTWVVPNGVSQVAATAIGAAGGGTNGGLGDGVSTQLPVNVGETLDVCVDSGFGTGFSAGGGASGVSAANDFSAPLIVAGGGGGASVTSAAGGSAGSPQASSGTSSGGGGGGFATQSAHGAGGTAGTSGAAGSPGGGLNGSGPGIGGPGVAGHGGGGGAGYFGGGGGGSSTSGGGGGGGGSDYCDTSLLGTCSYGSGEGTQNAAGPNQGFAQVDLAYLIGQSISFTSTTPGAATVGGSYSVSATGGGSGSPITFSGDPSSAGVCTVSGATVSFTGIGTCQVDANQAAGHGYTAAPQVNQRFTIAAAPPSPGGSGGSSGGSGGSPGSQSLTAPFASIGKTHFNAHTHKLNVTFTARGSVTGYQCAVVHLKAGKHAKQPRPTFVACASPESYKLKPGSYVFYLRAVGPGGTQAPAVTKHLTVG